jgi:hypothetical protein
LGEAVAVARVFAAADTRAAAVREALAPVAWRSLTVESMCIRAVAAMDGAGAFFGHDGSRRLLADCADALAEFMSCYRWRSLTLVGLSRLMVGQVESWHHERVWFDIRLGMLLDGIG